MVVRVGGGAARERARACVDTITRYADRELEIKVVADGDPRTGAELSSEHAAHVAVVGHDAIVTPGWLARQVALLAVDPTLSVVGPAMHRGEHAVFPLSTPQGLDPLCRVMPRRLFIDDLNTQIGRTQLKAGIAFDAFVHRQSHP